MDINMLLQMIAGRGGSMFGGGSRFQERVGQVQPGFSQQPTPMPSPVAPVQPQGANFLQQLLGMSSGQMQGPQMGSSPPRATMGGGQLMRMLGGMRSR